MKKRIFALALALCMMLSVMPTASANGILTLDNGSNSTNGILSLDNGTSGRSTPAPTQTRQNGVLYNTGSGSEGEEDVELQTTYSTGTGKSGEALQTSDKTAYTTAKANDLMEIEPVDHDSTKLKIDKKAARVNGSSDSDPVYQIDLTAQALSNIQVQTKVSAMDIILVLDRSGNMIDDSGYNNMNDLIKAINGDEDDANNKGFLETIKANAEDSRVAVVTYEGKGKAAVISGNGQPNNGAFVKLSDTTNYNALRGKIGNLTTVVNSDAYSNEGFKNAARIFQSVPESDTNYDNPRIVVFFTAGIPGNGSWNTTAYKIAQESIHWSVILKSTEDTLTVGTPGWFDNNDYDIDLSQEFWTWGGGSRTDKSVFGSSESGCRASVYCVGLNLDNCSGHTANSSEHDFDNPKCNGTRINEYLYRISSHRPDGSHVGDKRIAANTWEAQNTSGSWECTYQDRFTRNIKSNYHNAPASYYQVGSSGDISDMFQQINVNVEQNQAITDATMRDYLAPGFVPCDANGNVLAVGDTIDGGTVKKEGDIYYIEWKNVDLEPDKTGEKAFTPTIYAKPTGSLGGNDIRTNVYGASGLYAGDTLFASFPETTANVPVKAITPELNGADIYLTQSATLNNLLKAYDSRIDGLCNSGVAITYTIYEGTTEIGSVTIPKGGTAKAAEWKPAEGQTLTPKLTDDKTYTIKCTVNGGTGNTFETTSKAASVRVFKPVFEYQDSTIYLSNLPNYEKNLIDIEWKNGSNAANTTKMGNAPELTYSYESSDSTFSQCAKINVVVSKIGSTNATDELLEHVTFVNGTSHSGDEEADEFTVHVVKPVFSNEDTTIYLGNSVNLNSLMHAEDMWVCEDGEKLVAADAPVKPAHTYTPGGNTTVSPKACTTYGVETKVAGTKVYTGEIDVHVIQPTITFEDQDIYLSQTPVYAEPDFAWDTTCSGEHSEIPTVSGTDTEDSFEYDYDNEPAAFTQCADVDVTVWIDDVDYSAYVTLKNGEEERGAGVEKFTVHVYLPQIVLESQNLWADYDCDVTLTDGMKAPAIAQWIDQCGEDEEMNLSGPIPQCSAPVYQFTLNEEPIDVYNAAEEGITDQATIDVALSKIKIGDTEYEMDKIPAVGEVDYTVTVNKFDLTINKTWDDLACYAQDAIFTLKHGTGDNASEVTKVVIGAPTKVQNGQIVWNGSGTGKNTATVTVSGLLCGQDYTIEEDSNWTWRWKANVNSDGEEVNLIDVADCGSHSVKPFNPHDTTEDHSNPMARGEKTAEFVNTLVNRLWLSFCTFVRNIFGQAAIQKGGNF